MNREKDRSVVGSFPDQIAMRSSLDRATQSTGLRKLVALGGLDLAPALGLTDDAGVSIVAAQKAGEISEVRAVAIIEAAEMIGADWREHWQRHCAPAATPADPAGCADCQRTGNQQRGCWCWARTWREQQEVPGAR